MSRKSHVRPVRSRGENKVSSPSDVGTATGGEVGLGSYVRISDGEIGRNGWKV